MMCVKSTCGRRMPEGRVNCCKPGKWSWELAMTHDVDLIMLGDRPQCAGHFIKVPSLTPSRVPHSLPHIDFPNGRAPSRGVLSTAETCSVSSNQQKWTYFHFRPYTPYPHHPWTETDPVLARGGEPRNRLERSRRPLPGSRGIPRRRGPGRSASGRRLAQD